jgi:hypothetical protein
MNSTPDKPEDNSSWDLLASELGLDPAPLSAQPEASRKPVPERTKPVEPAAAEPVIDKTSSTHFDVKHPRAEPPAEDATEIITAADAAGVTILEDTVLEEGPELPDDLEPAGAEGTAGPEEEGEGGGRNRRRRRRRKKSPAEPAGNPAPPDVEDEIVAEPVAEGEPEFGEEVTAEIVGEAAAELEDEDGDEEIAPPHAAIEELEDESTEPLPEWKVMAWTDLLATLYRPQDR